MNYSTGSWFNRNRSGNCGMTWVRPQGSKMEGIISMSDAAYIKWERASSYFNTNRACLWFWNWFPISSNSLCTNIDVWVDKVLNIMLGCTRGRATVEESTAKCRQVHMNGLIRNKRGKNRRYNILKLSQKYLTLTEKHYIHHIQFYYFPWLTIQGEATKRNSNKTQVSSSLLGEIRIKIKLQ